MKDKIAYWATLPKKEKSFEGSVLFDNENQMAGCGIFDNLNINTKKSTVRATIDKVPCILYEIESAGKSVGYWCKILLDNGSIVGIDKTNVDFVSDKFPKDINKSLSSTDGYILLDMFNWNTVPADEEDTFANQVTSVCNEIRDLLIEKNKSYGNSALEPIHCFYKGSALESIKVRIDDKLSRLMRGSEYSGDDTVKDLLGYLVLLRVAEKNQKSK